MLSRLIFGSGLKSIVMQGVENIARKNQQQCANYSKSKIFRRSRYVFSTYVSAIKCDESYKTLQRENNPMTCTVSIKHEYNGDILKDIIIPKMSVEHA
jgi:hypothetical protein